MSVLTRAEARHRARLLDVQRYEIDLDLTRGEEVFGSDTVIRFTVSEPEADTFLELRPVTLRRAVLDGAELDPAALADGRLPLRGLTEGEHELRVRADMPYSRVGEGMHRFTDPADGRTYLYTQCCMSDAPKVFPCFDQPDLKAVHAVRVTAPPEWTVLGNGVARRLGEPDEGRWECAPTPPISTYLMAVAAGPYHSVRTEHAGIPFGLHVRRSLAAHLDADAEELLDLTRRCFDRYHEIFDEPYPFDSYDQAFVPEFNSGAMENPGLVTFRDEFVYRSAVTDTERQTRGMVIAHEMAHMWFGDLVTLRWWDDIWLNESFAEYMGYQTLAESTRFTDPWTDFAVTRKTWGYDADQRPSTHPVAPDPEAVPDTAAARLNFDGISYAKGASALRQLVAWLGEKTFLAGINEHFARHRFGNATLADFIDSLAHASTDRDVHGWAERWLRTTGVDTLTTRVSDGADAASGTADASDTAGGDGWRLTVTHTGERPHRLAFGLYDWAPGDPGRLVPRDRPARDLPGGGQEPGASGEFSASEETVLSFGGPRPALVLPNDGDLSYAKVRLDPDSWATLRRSLSGLPDPLSRAVVWNTVRDQVRDAELPPGAYLELLGDHLPRETDNAVVHGVLGFARTQIADRYLPAEERDAALAGLARVCEELLRGADEDGAGRALTAARHLIDSVTDPERLRSWRAAGGIPGGPRLDAELRWRLLLRLAVLGGVDADGVDRALADDPSATGQEGAARCHAALPDPASKAAAWAAMFDEPDTLSNYLFIATAQGFWQPEQQPLVQEFADRYFTDVLPLAERRGSAVAYAAGRFAFPRVVDEETRRRGEECLRSGAPLPALRRQLVDQLDDLRRALRVRSASG
ncbi:aminopeptidase N [Streptomyces sp. AJS327]|uniref:aminopeptidase N n=1 Tax=Streptomyces sp. AJS327 TaxID=2545265 RepID=UPI0015DEF668|nr:aminopeptidase N [Streptomyces sp. AJS327]MBA0050394.1 aminopeptidase N [Streptomyces sp. AJS327]